MKNIYALGMKNPGHLVGVEPDRDTARPCHQQEG